jgi:uncharacterized LabA/DUF88 family protein
MFENMFPDLEIVKVHYFSAELLARDPDSNKKLSRQKTYLRALAPLSPKLVVHLGRFRADERLMPISPLTISAVSGALERTKVVKFEEKGSDVHLASRLIADSATRNYGIGILLSNDSDFAPAVKIAIDEHDSRLWLVVPQPEVKRGSNELRRAGFERVIALDQRFLLENQFERELIDARGTFHRPKNGLKFREPHFWGSLTIRRSILGIEMLDYFITSQKFNLLRSVENYLNSKSPISGAL